MMVTRFALGCMAYGTKDPSSGWDPYTPEGEKVATDAIHTALDMGINYVDTGFFYGNGRSEEVVGKVMKTRRQDCYLGSKCDPSLDYDGVIRSCEDSLRRLQCDYLDLFQFHGSTKGYTAQDVERILHGGPLDAMKELQRRGLIRYIGISAEEYNHLEAFAESGEFDTIQTTYNIIRQGAGIHFLNRCRELNLGVIAMRGVTSGIFQEQLRTLCPEWNENNRASMVSLAFSLSDSRVHMVNIGMRTPASVKRNMDFLDQFSVKEDLAGKPITTAGIYQLNTERQLHKD